MSTATESLRPRDLSLKTGAAYAFRSQAVIALTLTGLLVVLGAATTPGFLTRGNLSLIIQLAAAIGVVSVGLAFVVLAKGVDLSVGAVAVVSAQIPLELVDRGMSESRALLVALLIVAGFGLVNGILVAYIELPSLFATLATGQLLVGAVLWQFLNRTVYPILSGSAYTSVDRASLLGIPAPVALLGAVLLVGHFVWTRTSFGGMVRAIGDNPNAARTSGLPVRPVVVSTYVVASVLAGLGGFMLAGRIGTVVTTGSAFTPMLFTAFTVVVIGGVALSGGRGSMGGVLAGVLLLGVLGNLLTLNPLSPPLQDLIRGAVLLLAIVLDAVLRGRDDETAKSSDDL